MRTRLSILCDKVIEAGWIAAVIIVPLFFNIYSQRVFEPDKLSLLRSLALVMGAVWLLRIAEDWRSGRSTPAETLAGWRGLLQRPMMLPILLLVLTYLVSTILSVNPLVSFLGSYQRLQGTYTTLSYLVVFFLMLEGLQTRRQFNRLVSVLVVVSFPIAMYGLIQHFGLDPLPWGGNVTTRVASNMGNAIFIAAYLIMVVPLTLSRLFENWKKTVGEFDARDGVLGFVAFVLLAGALLVAMLVSRTGADAGRSGLLWVRWLGLAVGVGMQVPIYLLTAPERRPRVLAIALPLTFGFLVAFSWVLEIFFPQSTASATADYFRLGVVAAVVFVVAMAAFAYYLRKPVARLLLLAGYFVILIAQFACIFYTQSRGPLLGLIAGLLAYFAVLGLIKRQVWLPWLVGGAAVAVSVFLIMFNTVESPLMDRLREVPYVGRLGQVLQTEEGTGKVRTLIWSGALDMISWPEPLETPGEDGGPDRLNALRPLVGYGPESMYVAYNRFYPPDLAHYEKRNASPDRSHNETFDSLVMTGVAGFLAYMLVFGSVVYFGLRWLGLVRWRWHARAFAGLWIAGGITGALATWAWRGAEYIGVGIPMGVMGGVALYLLGLLVSISFPRVRNRLRVTGGEELPPAGSTASLWILALFAAIVAHFVEIHFGIAIAATRTYFWAYCAMLIVAGTRLPAKPLPVESQPGVPEAETPKTSSRRRRRRGSSQPDLSDRSARSSPDWIGSVLVWSLVSILILSTMLFNSLTIQQNDPGVLKTIWQSLTRSQGEFSPVMLLLVLLTAAMLGLMLLADLATRRESAGKGAQDHLAAIGLFALLTLSGSLTFALVHARRLKPLFLDLTDPSNPLAGTIAVYYLFAFLVVFSLAATLAFLYRRPARAWRWTSWLAGAAVPVLGMVLLVVVGLLIASSNVSIVRADIYYKQGASSEKAEQWDAALYFYEEAIRIAPSQDFYLLFLGRAYMEKAKTVQAEALRILMEQSETALRRAREIAPLNTDHSANLARLYRTWGGLSSGDERGRLFALALQHYADANSLSPYNAQILNEWGQTFLALGDPDQALAKYQESLELDSEYAQTYLLLGEFYGLQGDWQAAIEAYGQATQINRRSASAYSSLGYAYSQVGDLDSAARAYERATELKPKNYTHHQNLAVVYRELGRTGEAIAEATRALELAPERQKAALRSFLAELGVPQEGLLPEDEQLVQELLASARARLDEKDWDGAAAGYQQAIELDPNSAEGHMGLAYAYAQQGRLEEAIAENQIVSSLVPTDYGSHMNLAILYQQLGDYAQALAEAEQALALAPEGQKPALQSLVDQLRLLLAESPASAPTPAGPVPRAGDLEPTQRNQLYTAPPPMAIDPSVSYQATIVTAKGNIVVDLDAAEAPQTVSNFVYLARQGFYDRLTFHRVETAPSLSIIQGGDPLGTGTGGPGYTVPAEIGLTHETGAIAMARLGDQVNPQRASSGSQFYICLAPASHLDGGYTVFGSVVEGLDVAGSIAVGDQILTIVITEEAP